MVFKCKCKGPSVFNINTVGVLFNYYGCGRVSTIVLAVVAPGNKGLWHKVAGGDGCEIRCVAKKLILLKQEKRIRITLFERFKFQMGANGRALCD